MQFPFSSRAAAWNLAVVVALTVSQWSFAQRKANKPQPGDRKIEAAGYLAQADRDLECSPESSKAWAKKALDTVGGVRQKDSAMHDMIDDLKTQSNLKIAEATKHIGQFTEAANEANVLVKQAKLETAEENLKKADPKGCYAGLKPVRAKLAQRKAAAAEIVRQGDLIVGASPKHALALYARAQKINAEYPELDTKITNAIQPQTRKRKLRTIGSN